jgi:hypothetical protein
MHNTMGPTYIISIPLLPTGWPLVLTVVLPSLTHSVTPICASLAH